MSDAGLLMDAYIELLDDTESPILFHRWSLITCVSALLGRNMCVELGTGPIYPNLFVVLLGKSGSRKSTSISLAANTIKDAGYRKFAGDRTSPEKFIQDLRIGFDCLEDSKSSDLIDVSFEMSRRQESNAFIKASELEDFMGAGNKDFISLLTNMYDNPPDYKHRTKNAKSETVNNPTISMLGGATSITFQRIFPSEIMGQGMLARLILIYGAGARKKIAFPETPNVEDRASIVSIIKGIKLFADKNPIATFSKEAKAFAKTIYETETDDVTDSRFESYNERRFIHFVKLSVVIAAMNVRAEVSYDDVFLANTILSYTEQFMPKAIGEFGMDKDAQITEKLYALLKKHDGLTQTELMKKGTELFKSLSGLYEHLKRLIAAERVDWTRKSDDDPPSYFVIPRVVESHSEFVDFNLLREYQENKNMESDIVLPDSLDIKLPPDKEGDSDFTIDE